MDEQEIKTLIKGMIPSIISELKKEGVKEEAPPAAKEEITEESIKKMLSSVLEQSSIDQSVKMNDALFQQGLKSDLATIEGLQSFLESNDDFGRKRLDILSEESDYEKRREMLDSLKERVTNATKSGGTGDVVTAKEKAVIKDSNDIDGSYEKFLDSLGEEGRSKASTVKSLFEGITAEMNGATKEELAGILSV